MFFSWVFDLFDPFRPGLGLFHPIYSWLKGYVLVRLASLDGCGALLR